MAGMWNIHVGHVNPSRKSSENKKEPVIPEAMQVTQAVYGCACTVDQAAFAVSPICKGEIMLIEDSLQAPRNRSLQTSWITCVLVVTE